MRPPWREDANWTRETFLRLFDDVGEEVGTYDEDPETTEVQEGYDALGRTLRRFGIRHLPWYIRDMGRNPQRSPR